MMDNKKKKDPVETIGLSTIGGALLGGIVAAVTGQDPIDGAIRGGVGGVAAGTAKAIYDEATEEKPSSKTSS